jgi:selenocysteine lyase/cysteine desulfurase
MGLDVRGDFPVTDTELTSPIDGTERDLVYLDHAASTHAPDPVLDAHTKFLSEAYANVHRGAHHLSIVSTESYEDVRWKCKAFVGARDDQQALFTQNTTAALDLAAHLVDDEPGHTLISGLEHHSNDLPHRARGPHEHIEVTDEGRLDLDDLEAQLEQYKTKLVAVTMASNVTGVRPPIGEITDLAHRYGARVLVDGAQGLAHLPIDLRDIGDTGGPDFFAAAGHKAYAPMGAAFLIAPTDLIDEKPPYRPGGGTVKLVGTDEVLWTRGHDRHEGGTPNIPGIVAMGAALDYLRAQGMHEIRRHEIELLERLLDGLERIDGVTVLGHAPPGERVGAIGFQVEDVPHGLVSRILDNEYGIATRNGCFCAHPYLVRLLGLKENIGDMRDYLREGGSTREPDFPGAVRASLGIYNTLDEIDKLVSAVEDVARQAWRGTYEWTEGQDWHPAKA